MSLVIPVMPAESEAEIEGEEVRVSDSHLLDGKTQSFVRLTILIGEVASTTYVYS